MLADLNAGARLRDCKNVIAWLVEGCPVNNCYSCTDPSVGLDMIRDEKSVKCYLADTGLLATMSYGDDEEPSPALFAEILQGKTDGNEGMLVENTVAQQLVAAGRPLHFYSSYSRTAADRMEIDFLIRSPYSNVAMKTHVSPVEVKSGKRYKTVHLISSRPSSAKRSAPSSCSLRVPQRLEAIASSCRSI